MGSMPQLVRKGKKDRRMDRRMGAPAGVGWEEIDTLELDARVGLIRELIPLSVRALSDDQGGALFDGDGEGSGRGVWWVWRGWPYPESMDK